MALSQNILDHIEKNYGFHVSDATCIHNGPDNDVYKIQTAHAPLILRLSKKTDSKNAETFAFEGSLLNHLRMHNVAVPKIITNNDGSYFSKTDNRFFVIFEFIESERFLLSSANKPPPAKVENAARSLAEMHKATLNSDIYSPSQKNLLDEIERPFRTPNFSKQYKQSDAFLKHCEAVLNTIKPKLTQYKSGILHNDYRCQNVLFNGDDIAAILDFDWSCHGPFIKDLAHAALEWSSPDQLDAPWPDVFQTFVNSYTDIHPIDITDLNIWICFSALSDTATYLCDRIDPESEPKEINSYMYNKFLFFHNNPDFINVTS